MPDGSPRGDADFRSRLEAALAIGGLYEELVRFSEKVDPRLGRDAVHDALTRILGGSDRRVENIRSFMFTTVRREVLQRLRSNKVPGRSCLGLKTEPTCESPSVLSQLVGEEQRRLLHDAISELPDRDREVAVLHVFEEMPLLEVADVLGIPSGTVKTRWVRALKAVTTRLTSILGDESGGS